MKTEDICEKCGEQKEMYYTPWCPVCDTPKPKIQHCLNLLQCYRHVDKKYFGIEDENDRQALREIGHAEVHDALMEWSCGANDVTVYLPILDASQGTDEIGELSEEAIEYLKTMVKAFDLEKYPNMMWECSW